MTEQEATQTVAFEIDASLYGHILWYVVSTPWAPRTVSEFLAAHIAAHDQEIRLEASWGPQALFPDEGAESEDELEDDLE